MGRIVRHARKGAEYFTYGLTLVVGAVLGALIVASIYYAAWTHHS